MDSFNITSHFAVALNAKFHVIHILKKYNFYHPDFFSLIHIFCVAITSKNHEQKWGSPFSFHRKTTTKRQFRLNLIDLREGNGASFKTNTLLAGWSSKSRLKALGLQ